MKNNKKTELQNLQIGMQNLQLRMYTHPDGYPP